jgi:hypothetical protein
MYNTEKHQDDIVYYTDVVSEPAKLIEFINDLDQYEKSHPSISKWRDWFASNDDSMLYGQTKMFNPIVNTDDESLNRKMLYVYNSLYSAFWFCSKIYAEAREIDLPGDKLSKNFVLNRYDTGKSMGPHIDAYNEDESNLKFSLVIYLNDNYEGGEINFPKQSFSVKPKAGSLIIFPSGDPYFHESRELVSGFKYMVPGFWLK